MFPTLAGNEVPSGFGRCSWRALEATRSAWRIVPQGQSSYALLPKSPGGGT